MCAGKNLVLAVISKEMYLGLKKSDVNYNVNTVPWSVHNTKLYTALFDVLLIVHLSIFILVFNQLDAQNLF